VGGEQRKTGNRIGKSIESLAPFPQKWLIAGTLPRENQFDIQKITDMNQFPSKHLSIISLNQIGQNPGRTK
jgi:hypothetical protein